MTGSQRFFVFASLLALLAGVTGCKPRHAPTESQTLASSGGDGSGSLDVDKERAESLFARAGEYVKGMETETVRGIKKAMCSLKDEIHPEGGNILNAIDGVALQGTIDFAEILGRGKSPVVVKGGVEYVWWFPPNSEEIEEHLHLIPHLGASTESEVADFELGVIYGCGGDSHAYGGYFGNVNAFGVEVNLGADLGPMFDNYFRSQVESDTPGGIDDVDAIDFAEATSTIRTKGRKLLAFAQDRVDFSRQNHNGAYDFESNEVPELTMHEIMSRVRLDGAPHRTWNTDLGFLFKRGLKFTAGLYNNPQRRNKILIYLNRGKNLTRRPGESEAAFKELRAPSVLPQYLEVMNYLGGNPEKQSTLKDPDGVLQTMSSVSSGLFIYNSDEYEVALNTEARGTDGEWLGSVKDDYRREVKSMLFGNRGETTYGCVRQRERYPDTRWFIVYVNGRKLYADCYGYGEGEILVEEPDLRLLSESDFEQVTREMEEIKTFFEDFEAMRYAVRHARIQLNDAFNTETLISELRTGGIRRNTDGIFTGCNSVTLDRQGWMNAARLSFGSIKSAVASVRNRAISGGSLFHALKEVGKESSFGVDVSHYYHTPYHNHYHASEGWPILRTIRALKNIDCSEDGIPSLEGEGGHHGEDSHDGEGSSGPHGG